MEEIIIELEELSNIIHFIFIQLAPARQRDKRTASNLMRLVANGDIPSDQGSLRD
jgi:hypothetical protein